VLRNRKFPVLVLPFAIGALAVGGCSGQAQAGPPPPVTVLDPGAVRASGRSVALPVRHVDGLPLVEPRRGASAFHAPVVAIAPDGLRAAFAELPGGQVAPLTISQVDGSQVDFGLPGSRGAAFAADGSWLVAVDGAGGLWRIETSTNVASQLAAGPFGSSPVVLTDGQILAIHLSSLEAPAWARSVFVDAETGEEAPMTVDDGQSTTVLTYQALPLGAGSAAIVRHRDGGGVSVFVVTNGSTGPSILDLDQVATVDVSTDGARVAWAAAGRIHLASSGQPASDRDLGPGDRVRFSPDGQLLLVTSDQAGTILDLSGAVVGSASPVACWLGDGRGCRP
jgi:hypothetical protein